MLRTFRSDCEQRYIERAPSSGRPHTTRTAENVDAVGDLEIQPLHHSTDLMRARNTSNI